MEIRNSILNTSIKKALLLLSPREKLQLYLLFTGLAFVALLDMLGIASIMPFMAVVANPKVVETNHFLSLAYEHLGFTDLNSFLLFLGLSVFGLLVVGNLCKALTNWATLHFDNQLNYALARRLLGAYLMRPYEFFLNRNSAEMGKNVLSEVRTVISGILSPGMQLLSNSMLAASILVLLMVMNPYIAMIIGVALGGVYGIIYSLARRHLSSIGAAQIEANTMKYKAANEALCGIKDLKILGREQAFLETFSIHAQNHARMNATAGVISQLPRYALETIAFGGILLIVLFYMGSEKADQIVPLLALYAFAGYRLLPALQLIFSSISSIRYHSAALDVLYRDLKRDQSVSGHKPEIPAACALKPLPMVHDLTLKNVSYRYPGGQSPVIADISLTITRNTSVGFVGGTGSGKTTIVDLILGLLSPSSGQLIVDGTELNGANTRQWQRNLGYVPQQIYLSDDTIIRNIAFGVPDHEIDLAAVIHAARIANLDAFIKSELAGGYRTVIGERGVRLSGGQRQRIGIARALYCDPDVLIMDEATSALDGITEAAVMDALNTLAGSKTIILVAHRLTTVKDCDVIYRMEFGRIVNQGTYDELMESSAWFQAVARKDA
jgi:ATP-binding cassette, subfamily B, bacterial PglK